MTERVMVFGATGFTGGLVCRSLAKRGIPFAVAGRDEARVRRRADETGAQDAVVADVTKPETLGALTAAPVRLLVNCAGPFLRYGWPVAEAAVTAGVHYLDTTGEQPFIKRVADSLDGPAQERGSTVVNAMAMEYAVGDWAARIAIDRCPMDAIEEVTVAYSLQGEGITRGTALSILEMLGRRGWSWEGGHYHRRPAGFTARTIPFPFGERLCLWAPFGEIVFLARLGSVRTVMTYLRMPRSRAMLLRLMTPGGLILRPLLRFFAGRKGRTGPTESQRRRSRFTIVAGADGSRVVVSGNDPYGLTAEIVALGVEHVLGPGAPAGVRSPATIGLDGKEALRAVGVVVE